MPNEFYDMCWEETSALLAAMYNRRSHDLQNTRLLMYTMACTVTKPEERGEVYDMFWLPGDPTPEERMQQHISRNERMVQEARELAEMIRKEQQRK